MVYILVNPFVLGEAHQTTSSGWTIMTKLFVQDETIYLTLLSLTSNVSHLLQ